MPRLRSLTGMRGLNEAAVEKLGAMGIQSVQDLLFLTCTNFTSVVSRSGIPEKELKGIVRMVSREFGSFPQSASMISNRWKERSKALATGSAALNDLLTGGFFTGEITELVGPCASGKTQLCMALAVRTCAVNRDSVAFLNSGSAFSLDRTKEIAVAQHRAAFENRAADEDDTDEMEEMWDAPLQRLKVYSVASADDLLWHLVKLEQDLERASERFFRTLKLIIIDSVGSVFAPIIGGASNVGHSLLVSVVQILQRISSTFNVSVVVTNHTTSGVNGFHQHQVRKSNKNHTLATAEFQLCDAGVSDQS